MKKILSLTILLLITHYSFSQETIAENYSFKFLKAKKNSKLLEGTTRAYTIKVDKEKSEKIQIRFKIKSLSKEKDTFNPNKLYLISDKHRIRLRPIDITRNFGAGWIFYGFGRLIQNQTDDKRINEWANYKSEIEDVFYNYTQEGYEDISPKINIGSNRKPKIIEPYYDLDDIKSCKIDVYFGVPKDFKKGKLFYAEALIADFEL